MKEVEEANEAGIVLPKPKFAYTCIQLYSDEMRDAFITFQQAADRHFGSDQNFGLQMRNSLSSPYPFWFHCRKTGIVNRLPGRTQELIKLLTDWIEGQYSEHYCETINMFDKGFTTAANMLYLIAPGDVFTWKEASGALRAYKSESWPRLDAQNTVASTGDPDKRWQISAWTYHYDGRFYRKHRELDICSGSEPEDDEELAICSLRAVPLRLHSDTIGFKLAYPTTDPGDYEDFGLLDDEDGPQGNDIMLFPQNIIGYDMRRKAWSELDVDRVREVQWRKEAFHHLVIDEETKDLIHALITNKIAANKSTDWIGTKGNGLIMLLHGGPGTGKTFTAESVAELAQKPLYSVTCGDIGTKPEDVEKYLESVLYLGKVWDCIVLLDEADVFLEQRTLSDLKRNALVSIFLRVLEYYEGIMILTSNRVGIFDEAFKSRIQLALHYERLGRPERSKIWRNFLNRLQVIGEENIDYVTIESYIEELSEYEMNGRQIRNAITTARQLAQFKKQPMTYGHLRHVIKVAGKFDNYIRGVHEDMSDDMIARGEGIR
ncbi:hypothetical protein N8I77_000466 [Diaporthe amygdali]|uniref:AAA+ ATPase domain-containing protein n=1 Tax=Phomopsis amygdali TaxID=1214568 RepID=A0AAD9SPT0_PHOAM|nr:hypothetical protein N8I77_000466 [Diaporthe amygdali]